MRARVREREEKISCTDLLPQMALIAGAGQVGGQESGTSSGSPMCLEGPKFLHHPSLLSEVHWQAAGLEHLGLEPARI